MTGQGISTLLISRKTLSSVHLAYKACSPLFPSNEGIFIQCLVENYKSFVSFKLRENLKNYVDWESYNFAIDSFRNDGLKNSLFTLINIAKNTFSDSASESALNSFIKEVTKNTNAVVNGFLEREKSINTINSLLTAPTDFDLVDENGTSEEDVKWVHENYTQKFFDSLNYNDIPAVGVLDPTSWDFKFLSRNCLLQDEKFKDKTLDIKHISHASPIKMDLGVPAGVIVDHILNKDKKELEKKKLLSEIENTHAQTDKIRSEIDLNKQELEFRKIRNQLALEHLEKLAATQQQYAAQEMARQSQGGDGFYTQELSNELLDTKQTQACITYQETMLSASEAKNNSKLAQRAREHQLTADLTRNKIDEEG
jgi:hypothetical protein